MRTFLPIVCAAAITGVAVWTCTATADAEQGFKLRIADSKGKPAANLPVSINGQGLGRTNNIGELELALDPAKNGRTFNVYRKNCSELVMFEEGTPEDDACKRESQQNANQNECQRGCKLVGAYIFGRDATVGHFSGGRIARNATIGGVLGAAAAGALIATRGGGGDANGAATAAPPSPPFAGLTNNYPLNSLAGNSGCPGFTPTAVATMTMVIDAVTGVGTLAVQYSGSRTDYSNARAVKEAAQSVITAGGANVITATRNFVADVMVVVDPELPLRSVQSGSSHQARVVRFQETFRQTTGAGSPCTQMYAQ